MPILRANPPDLGKNRANGGSGLKSSPKVPPGPPKMALQRKMGGVPEMGGVLPASGLFFESPGHEF